MKLYRPVWTCGRFNAKALIAIYYNLIEGIAYTFEESSALVVGYILKITKGNSFELEELSDELLIEIECLLPFIDELCYLGLLSKEPMSNEIISEHRNFKKRNKHILEKSPHLKNSTETNKEYPIEMNDAELFYHEKSGDITNIMIEVTYNCSEQCIHCYNIGASRNNLNDNKRNSIKSLSLSEYKDIINQFHEKGLVKVCITGGDPFSFPHIWELLEYLYNKDIAIDVYTNGISVIGQENRLSLLFPRLVGISLYSGDRTIHESITRRVGSWDKTISVVKKLSELAVPLVLKCCIMKPNVFSYHTVFDIGEQIGIPVQFDINVTDSVDGDKYVSRNLRITTDILEVILCDPLIPLSITSAVQQKEFPTLTSKQLNVSPCMAGHNSFCVTPDGNLIPCCAFHYNLGDLKSEQLFSILENSRNLEIWKKIRISDLERCGSLPYCAFCSLCCGLNYSEHKNILQASENGCYLAKIRYNLTKKMREEDYDPLHGKSVRERLTMMKELDIERKKDK